MVRRAVDVVAAGPPSADLYDPAAPAWALASGLAARGHSVQVTYPGPAEGAEPPPGVAVAPFPPVTTHVGTYLGDAELARSAGRRIRPDAELVVRDPSGLGSLGRRAGHHALVSFVRALAADAEEAQLPATEGRRRLPKVLSWGERRGVRKLEREALSEATMVYCSTVTQRDRLREDYGLSQDRLRVGPPAVPKGPTAPTREAARRLLEVPDDILLGVVLPPVEPADPKAVPAALEAFHRTRPIFPGARLAVVGAPGATGPGVLSVPGRDAATLATAAAAADVALAFPSGTSVDPGLVVAFRAGVACVLAPTVDLGPGSEAVTRRALTSDAGELASVLAELFADPEERRTLGEAARAFSRRFDPERLAEELETAGALRPG